MKLLIGMENMKDSEEMKITGPIYGFQRQNKKCQH